MTHRIKAKGLFVAGLALSTLGLSGCYAKKKDVQAEFARVRQEMQQADQALDQKQTQALTETTNRLNGRIDAVEREVQRLNTALSDLNVKVTRLNGLIAFQVPVHFEFDKADLRESDRAVLKRFASVVNEFYPGALITAEGYTDPAGSQAYNQRLGKKRADSVRQFLTTEGGLGEQHVRAVSYGEVTNRLVDKAAQGPGEKGIANRRVVLVFDYVGTAIGVAPPVITN
ncbi:MAG: OmpA family protein [Longimicrobiales bacterium]